MRPAAKPAQVPKGTFPTPLEPVKAPGRDSGEAASTDVPRGARSARELRHRPRASPADPNADTILNPMKPSARPARARRLSRPGRASPEQDRLALPAAPQGSVRLTDSIHRVKRPINLTPCAGARWRFPRRRVAADTGCAPKGEPESAPRVRNPASASREGWRTAIRSMPAPASRSASRTDRPRGAPCRTARSEPSGGASRGRPTAGSLQRAPRTEPAAPPAKRRFPKKPPQTRRQDPDRIGTGPPGERPTALRRADRSPNRPFARERGGRLPGLRLPSSRGGPEGLCRVSAKDACSDTFAYRLHGILLLLERSRRLPVLGANFLCMKDVVRTIDAHVIHKTIHSARCHHHGWRFTRSDPPRKAIPARPQGSGGRGALRPPHPWPRPPVGRHRPRSASSNARHGSSKG